LASRSFLVSARSSSVSSWNCCSVKNPEIIAMRGTKCRQVSQQRTVPARVGCHFTVTSKPSTRMVFSTITYHSFPVSAFAQPSLLRVAHTPVEERLRFSARVLNKIYEPVVCQPAGAQEDEDETVHCTCNGRCSRQPPAAVVDRMRRLIVLCTCSYLSTSKRLAEGFLDYGYYIVQTVVMHGHRSTSQSWLLCFANFMFIDSYVAYHRASSEMFLSQFFSPLLCHSS